MVKKIKGKNHPSKIKKNITKEIVSHENNSSKTDISKPNNKKRQKTKKKKIIILTIIILLLIIIGIITSNYFIDKYKKQQLVEKRELLVEKIQKNYHKIVKTTTETELYKLENNVYQVVGKVGNNINLPLKEIDITYETKYFPVADTEYFIDYQNVTPSEEIEQNNRYKSYVVFNQNILTKEETSFYDEDNNLFMKINQSYELPIIIKDKERYGVEFYNQLLYVSKEDVEKVVDSSNTKDKTRTNIRTLTYHTVYNKKTEKCNNIYVCHPIEQFDEHMKYLSENNYLTLTMEELEMFLDGKIRIPTKSIVITLDDGKKMENSVPIVEKYKIHATFFVITSKFSIEKFKESKYAHFESHTDNMHNNYVCNSGYYGGQMLCENYDKIIKDLKLSQEKLGGSVYFAYPFFDSNARAIKALKETGFKMAFIGQYDTDGYSTPKTDRFQIRRKTVFGDTSLKTMKSYLN